MGDVRHRVSVRRDTRAGRHRCPCFVASTLLIVLAMVNLVSNAGLLQRTAMDGHLIPTLSKATQGAATRASVNELVGSADSAPDAQTLVEWQKQQQSHKQSKGAWKPQGDNGAPILARLHAMAAAAAADTAKAKSPRVARVGLDNRSEPRLSAARVRQLIRQFHGRKFLFPLLDQGPNNQFLQFRVALAKARQLNRTLVLPIWLPHNPRFQHFHPGAPATPSRDKKLEQLWYPFETAFEPAALDPYVRHIPLHVFRAICGGAVQRCVAAHADGFEPYLRLSRITCEKFESRSVHNMGTRFLGFHLYDVASGTRERLFEYVKPSKLVAGHATSFAGELFGARAAPTDVTADAFVMDAKEHKEGDEVAGEVKLASTAANPGMSRPYLAVHLRVADAHWERSDCRHAIRNMPVPSVSCGDPANAINHTGIARALIFAIRGVRESDGPGLADVYVATNMDCLDKRMAAVASTLWRTVRATLVCNQTLLLKRVSHDNFLASLIEQELCARALAFVGSKFSTWTDTVRGMRASRNGMRLTYSFEDMWSQGIR